MKRALVLMTVLGFASLASAQVWTEQGDAGELPPGQAVVGSGPLSQIDGFLGVDADMYQIQITDFANFRATTTGGTSLDTQLSLFDSNGNGVTFSDDAVGGSDLTSLLTGQYLTGNGIYYLAVANYDYDPTSGGQEIWLDQPFRSERQPDGPGAGGVVDGWGGTTFGGDDSYSIFLAGAAYVPEPATLSLLALGGLFLIRRR